MQIPIETWLAAQDLPREALVAFEEAVKAYKVGLYRSALLFSYVGWGLTVRRRVLVAKCPNGMPPQKWQEIQKVLRDDDRWDDKAFECTQMKDSPVPIFVVSDGLREEVRYWKNRRNDCAHFKVNEITSAHVESFWAFLRSNLPKFVPNGSLEDLLDQISRHFDPNYTPPGTALEPIIRTLPEAVVAGELPRFFGEVSAILSTSVGGAKVLRTAEMAEVIGESLRLNNRDVTAYLQDYLPAHAGLQLAVLRKNPTRVALWKDQQTVIRALWRERLFSDGHEDLRIYASLVRNGLIPEQQVAEANLRAVERMGDEVPHAEDEAALRGNGFLDALGEWCFAFQDSLGNAGINDFGWGNKHTKTILWLFSRVPASDDLVGAVCRTFIGRPYPDAVRDALRTFYDRHPEKKEEFELNAERLDARPPKSIFAARPRLDDLDDDDGPD